MTRERALERIRGRYISTLHLLEEGRARCRTSPGRTRASGGGRDRASLGDRLRPRVTLVDLLVLVWVALAAFQGAARGLSTQVVSLAGLAVGGLIGSRIAPRFLEEGAQSPWLPVAALVGAAVGAIVFQLVVTSLVSRLGLFLPAPVRLIDSLGGALLGAVVGLAIVWLVAVVALQQPSLGLRKQVQRSEVLPRLVDAVPPRNVLHALGRFDPLPLIEAIPGESLPPSDPSVRALAGGPPGCASSREGLGNGMRTGPGGVRVGRRTLPRRDERARHRRGARYPCARAERQEPSRPARVRGRPERRRPAPGAIARCRAASGGPCGGGLAPSRSARLSTERPARLRAWHCGPAQANRQDRTHTAEAHAFVSLYRYEDGSGAAIVAVPRSTVAGGSSR